MKMPPDVLGCKVRTSVSYRGGDATQITRIDDQSLLQLTSLKAVVIFEDMSGMYRITSMATSVLLRLVMVLSLAGYSFSAVNAAMHPAEPPSVSQVEEDHSSHHGGDHVAEAKVDHHGDQHDHAGTEKSKNSCCKDYCGVAALTCSGSLLNHPRVVSPTELADDKDTVGEAPSPHRPPNI